MTRSRQTKSNDDNLETTGNRKVETLKAARKHRHHNHRLAIEYLPVDALLVNPNSPRLHSDQQIAQVAASLSQFGVVLPVLIDETNMVLAGHVVVAAARQTGILELPTVRASHLNATEKRALIIALNRLAENSGWDMEILSGELSFLSGVDLDFDIGITGFSTAEIDLITDQDDRDETCADPADELPDAIADDAVVSRPGNLWLLGANRLYCGDALDMASYDALMAGQRAEMIFVDPPYNVAIAGNVSGLGKVRHEDFAMAAGEMGDAEFVAFLERAMRLASAHSIDGSIHYWFMDWRHLDAILTAGNAVYTRLMNLCVWAKTNAGMGSFYRSQHELVLVFKNGKAKHINNFGLGQHGRWRSNIWRYAGVNSFKKGRIAELASHPTVKPVALVADAIRDCSNRKGIILDNFAGSGTTIIAAEKTGRRAYAIELDPKYVDVAIRRWQVFTGRDATDAETGLTFHEIAAQRQTAGVA